MERNLSCSKYHCMEKKYTGIYGLFIEETMALMKKIHCDSNMKRNKGVAN